MKLDIGRYDGNQIITSIDSSRTARRSAYYCRMIAHRTLPAACRKTFEADINAYAAVLQCVIAFSFAATVLRHYIREGMLDEGFGGL